MDVAPIKTACDSKPPHFIELDKLGKDREKSEWYDEDKEHKSKDSEDCLQSQIQREAIDQDAKQIETQLQLNLKQQQAHYAHQRRIFENLRKQSYLSSNGIIPTNSSTQYQSSSSRKSSYAAIPNINFQHESLPPDSQACPKAYENHSLSEDEWSLNEVDTIAKKLFNCNHEQAHAEAQCTFVSKDDQRWSQKDPTAPLKEMHHQEASNNALHRQSKLLHRLQLENNRFYHEMKSLQEQNESLKERCEIREDEVVRLREQMNEFESQFQPTLVDEKTVAQTRQKTKAMQRTITAAQAEIFDLQAALQEAGDSQSQLKSDCQLMISDLEQQVRRWKRTTKQLRRHELCSNQEIEKYKKTVLSLERKLIDTERQVKKKECETARFAAITEKKTAHCKAVEMSATDCVIRLEDKIETLQEAHEHECKKRKEMETACCNLQLRMEHLQAEYALRLEKQRELEQQIVDFQENLMKCEQTSQDQLEKMAFQLEECDSRRNGDAATINGLREEYESLENRLRESQVKAKELKSHLMNEAHVVKRHAEALGAYMKRVLDSKDNLDLLALISQEDLDQSSCKLQMAELLFVQDAMSILQTETINLVREFQRTKHMSRQQGNNLSLAIDRVSELEQLQAQEAVMMKDLRDQCKVAEEARAIVTQEKLDILEWSGKCCKRKEETESELTMCKQLLNGLRKTIHDALKTENFRIDLDVEHDELLVQACHSFENEIAALVAIKDHWRGKYEKCLNDVKDKQAQNQSLNEIISEKTEEFQKSVCEVERVYSEKLHVQQLQFEKQCLKLANDHAVLESKFRGESVRVVEKEGDIAKLQQMVDGMENDRSVFTSILHLFVLVVQPLVLQVGDLQAQKRYLLRENAEYAKQHEQIECIGNVLREMLPAVVQDDEKVCERPGRRVFRHVVSTVLAINRFRIFADHRQSTYGLAAPFMKTKRYTLATAAHLIVIKVLPPRQTLSESAIRLLLDRFQNLNITLKLGEVVDASRVMSANLPVFLGNLIYNVMMVIDPTLDRLFVASDNGKARCKRVADQYNDLSTVALIRKRILALGQRVADLLHQRNLLQQENGELQSQLNEQTNSLKEMHVLSERCDDLQHEMAALRSQTDSELQKAQKEHNANDQERQLQESNLVAAQAKIEALLCQVFRLQGQIEQVEAEKSTLQCVLDQLQSKSIEEESKANYLSSLSRRLEEEVRSLKQAIKSAHELYQKASLQLEQEVLEKAKLHTMVNLLRQKEENETQKFREERLQKLEKTLRSGLKEEKSCIETMVRQNEETAYGANSTLSTNKPTEQSSFAQNIDTVVSKNVAPSSRQHTCENSVSDKNGKNDDLFRLPSSPFNHSTSFYFSKDWQRSNVPRAPKDANSGSSRIYKFQTDTIDLNNLVTMNSLTKSNESNSNEQSRKRVETEKVNATVYDYINRMDDKLSKVYGIPPSTKVRRSQLVKNPIWDT
ncbi:uncharacterized protein PHALS_09507 [Plasmopara halstedii]|uniref:Uncharacterized protein n=1 Tax=Plasmopara halstedii TaxID=4781 RepID=A0A0P1A4D0_PLAHL|nr:uncharacterized protein PHALS_09507 [Plasmopara halstedii]CEG35384.1 hypothetical protein PHALS_09507 [Plasmopara halstedii]|eukprot:XP_024571753.1 hypothetical protein PHALS_09507 [Plasmopara halstedii]